MLMRIFTILLGKEGDMAVSWHAIFVCVAALMGRF